MPANTQNHDVLLRRLFHGARSGIRANTASEFDQRVRSSAVTENHLVSIPDKMLGVYLRYLSCSNKSEFHMRFLLFFGLVTIKVSNQIKK
jgi:hypothetical protein